MTDQVSGLVNSLFNSAQGELSKKGNKAKAESVGEEGYAYSDGVYTEDDIGRGVYASYGYMGASAGGGIYGGGYTQIVNVNQQVSTADELARAVELGQYGLMVGKAR